VTEDVQSVTNSGRLFHTRGPTTVTASFLIVFYHVAGMAYGFTRSGTGCFIASCTHMATVGVKWLIDHATHWYLLAACVSVFVPWSCSHGSWSDCSSAWTCSSPGLVCSSTQPETTTPAVHTW